MRYAAAVRWRSLLAGVLALVALLLVAGGAWFAWRLSDHPDLAAHADLTLQTSPAGDATAPAVRVTFLGVSTLLVSDGETALLTDGFFSRPGKWQTALGTIAPHAGAITAGLDLAGIDAGLAAVIVVHSHYDHAMDAPEVARRTGALLIGSESTRNVGRGAGLAEERMRLAEPAVPVRIGAFTVTLLPAGHLPHGVAMGVIDAPLVPPVRSTAYQEGGSYSVLLEHPLGSLLVQGSAGWLDGALAGRHADVVLLGVGGLGSQDGAYRETLYREVVEAVGARCVVPIHWDDFTLPLGEPLRPMPRLLDDFDGTMRWLRARTGPETGLGLLPLGRAVALLGSGAAPCGPRRG